VVAILLGAMLFAVVNGRGGLVTPPAVNEIASADEPAERTGKVDAPVAVTAPELTAIDREILLREAAETAAAAKAASEARQEPAPDPAFLANERPEASSPARSMEPRPRSRTARRARSTGRTPAEEEDFLRREGYIY
jgi:hypothetical protein